MREKIQKKTKKNMANPNVFPVPLRLISYCFSSSFSFLALASTFFLA